MTACAAWARVPDMHMGIHLTLQALARGAGNKGVPPAVRRQAAAESAMVEATGRAIGAYIASTFSPANDPHMAPPAPSAA